MKLFKYILVIFTFSIIGILGVDAKKNPYPHYEDLGFGKIVNCTWYAWEEVKSRRGIELPTWYNVWTWHTKAKKSGFSTGKEPRKDSLMIWNYGDGFGGHVSYVTNVSGSVITYDEGGAMNSTGIATNQTITLEEVKSLTSDYGFIYLDVPVSTTTKITTTKKSTTKNTTTTIAPITTEEVTKEDSSTALTTSINSSTMTTNTQITSSTNDKDQNKDHTENYSYLFVIGAFILIILIFIMINRFKK